MFRLVDEGYLVLIILPQGHWKYGVYLSLIGDEIQQV